MAKQMTTRQNWNNIKGDMRLCARCCVNSKGERFVSYSTSIGKKNESGEYDNVYFDVYFKKEKAPEKTDKKLNKKFYDLFIDGNATYMNVNIVVYSGFLTVKTYKDGVARPAIMIMDYGALPGDFKKATEQETTAPDKCPF